MSHPLSFLFHKYRFLVFEQEPIAHKKEMDISNKGAKQTSPPLAEAIQKRLNSILLAWQSDAEHYFEV